MSETSSETAGTSGGMPAPTSTSAPRAPSPGGWKALFVGSRGWRPGWQLLLFVVLYSILAAAGTLTYLRFDPGIAKMAWTPRVVITQEVLSIAALAIALGVMSRLERRPIAAYGLAGPRPPGKLFWEGALWGALSIALVMLLITAAGGYSVSGVALGGAGLAVTAALWGLACLLIALNEEVLFRGYGLFTLARGLGFWGAAVLLSLVFGALHYFLKPMESWMDGLSVTLIGLFFCLSVRRTGSIWLAMGWHFTYNYGSFFVFGGPNTGNDGQPMPGHLLHSLFHGPQWLTGGPAGPEASAFIFVVIALLFAALHLRYPRPLSTL
ncbi:MAG TPA: CPBP family intramembrane glutamic endopeptidase [Thermoanaerobaculia bacterium]|nr:CPBP family intramembrane glutamic endopeptidase [Thermoanaerobaculia bacterium]